MITYREYKPKWLKERIFVDTYGREYNLSDTPMTYMSREDAFQKRGYDDEQIDKIYDEWIRTQISLTNKNK